MITEIFVVFTLVLKNMVRVGSVFTLLWVLSLFFAGTIFPFESILYSWIILYLGSLIFHVVRLTATLRLKNLIWTLVLLGLPVTILMGIVAAISIVIMLLVYTGFSLFQLQTDWRYLEAICFLITLITIELFYNKKMK